MKQNTTEARQELSTALAGFRRLQGEVASINEASTAASEVAQDTRTALDALEEAVRRQARADLEGDPETTVDLEPRITACKRRLEVADEIVTENAEAVRALQPQVSAAGEKVRWSARAVMEAEGEHLLDRYERVQREALTLRWRIEKLCSHLMRSRGSREDNQRFAAFDAPARLIERLKNALYMDEWQRWPVAEFETQWHQFEKALQTDPDAAPPA